jgi:hypothetical protein
VHDKIRSEAVYACGELLIPLVKLLLQLGISAGEFAGLAKRAYVKAAAVQLLTSSRRVSQSRIAIVTGLTRAEVKKLLNAPVNVDVQREWQLHRAIRVLNGWHDDPEFTRRDGRPKDLPIKGRGSSFQALVRRYSGDIPMRAMLDELLAAAAVKKQPNGQLRVKARTIAVSGMQPRAIQALGEKTRDLLSTLVHNLEQPEDWRFEGTATSASIDPRVAPLLKQVILTQGRSFLDRIEHQLNHSPMADQKKIRESAPVRLGVTVFLHETTARTSKSRATARRKRSKKSDFS